LERWYREGVGRHFCIAAISKQASKAINAARLERTGRSKVLLRVVVQFVLEGGVLHRKKGEARCNPTFQLGSNVPRV